jgi:hypothetical protein
MTPTATFLIFKLWLAPTLSQSAHVGAKATLQVGSNLWLKVRVVDTQTDLSTMQVNLAQPKVKCWAETDF